MYKSSYVIIPNWNGIDFIDACLSALQQQTQPHTVIVVDNGSTDGSNDVVRKKFPSVQLIEFPDNAGFAGGVNRGIQPAIDQGAEYIALLNNDAVADGYWLERLLDTMEANPRAGAVTAKILTADGKRLDSTGDFYSVWGMPFPRGRGEQDRGQYDNQVTRNIFAASGGASLYRVSMFQEIGLFDEDFFAYYEDIDIAFRAQLRGWEILYEPAAKVRHYIGGTSSRITDDTKLLPKATELNVETLNRPSAFARYHSVKNFSYLYTKNMPGWLYWKYLPRFMTSWLLMITSDVRRGLFITNLKANITALIHLPGMLRKRTAIQASRNTAISHIDAILYPVFPPLQRQRFERLGFVRPRK